MYKQIEALIETDPRAAADAAMSAGFEAETPETKTYCQALWTAAKAAEYARHAERVADHSVVCTWAKVGELARLAIHVPGMVDLAHKADAEGRKAMRKWRASGLTRCHKATDSNGRGGMSFICGDWSLMINPVVPGDYCGSGSALIRGWREVCHASNPYDGVPSRIYEAEMTIEEIRALALSMGMVVEECRCIGDAARHSALQWLGDPALRKGE
jgi:hypothetical protein